MAVAPPSPPARRRIAARLAAVLFGLLLGLAGLEIALRLFYPPLSLERVRTPDPVLGWRLDPGGQVNRRRPEYTVSVTLNARGWRDVEHALAPPPGAFRILVLGDSFMYGNGVNLEEVFSRRLEAAAHAAGYPQVEVINLGVSGYGTLQQYLLLVEEGLRYDPDLVLLAFYAENDPGNNSQVLSSLIWSSVNPNSYGRPYLAPGADDEWVIIPPDYARAQAAAQRSENRAWWQRTALAAVIDRLLLQRQLDATADLRITYGAFLCEESPDYAAAWALTARILHRLDSAVRAHGAGLVVFSVPSRAEVDPAFAVRIVEQAGPGPAFCFEDSPANARLLSILEEAGIPSIDLLPAFRAAARSGGQVLFYERDPHWNPGGHALAAEQVLAALIEQGRLPPEVP